MPSCAEAGVLGVLPGIVGVIQATEAVKWILGVGRPLVGRLLLYDALAMTFREVSIARDRDCPMCGDHPSIEHLIDYEQFCGLTPANLDDVPHVDAAQFAAMTGAQLIDVREPAEHDWLSIPDSVLIPLDEVQARAGEIDRPRKVVVHCHSGVRSAEACRRLIALGFQEVYNLQGGIEAWLEFQNGA